MPFQTHDRRLSRACGEAPYDQSGDIPTTFPGLNGIYLDLSGTDTTLTVSVWNLNPGRKSWKTQNMNSRRQKNSRLPRCTSCTEPRGVNSWTSSTGNEFVRPLEHLAALECKRGKTGSPLTRHKPIV